MDPTFNQKKVTLSGANRWAKLHFNRLLKAAIGPTSPDSLNSLPEDFKRLEIKSGRLVENYRSLIRATRRFLRVKTDGTTENVPLKEGPIQSSTASTSGSHPSEGLGNALIQTGMCFEEGSLHGTALTEAGKAHKEIGVLWQKMEQEVEQSWITELNKIQDDEFRQTQKLRFKVEAAQSDLASRHQKLKRRRAGKPEGDPSLAVNEVYLRDHAELRKAEATYARRLLSYEAALRNIANEGSDALLLNVMDLLRSEVRFHQAAQQRLEKVLEEVTDRRRGVRRQLIKDIRGLQVEGIAMFPFTATNSDEVSMGQQDRVQIVNIDCEEDDYWEVSVNGSTGLVPANFVGFEVAVARYDYPPAGHQCNTDELEFVAGAEIIVINYDGGDDEWLQGVCNGKIGVFALAYAPIRSRVPAPQALAEIPFPETGDSDSGFLFGPTSHAQPLTYEVIRTLDAHHQEGRQSPAKMTPKATTATSTSSLLPMPTAPAVNSSLDLDQMDPDWARVQQELLKTLAHMWDEGEYHENADSRDNAYLNLVESVSALMRGVRVVHEHSAAGPQGSVTPSDGEIRSRMLASAQRLEQSIRGLVEVGSLEERVKRVGLVESGIDVVEKVDRFLRDKDGQGGANEKRAEEVRAAFGKLAKWMERLA
ncbi:hypothetical protein BJ742DRAFT_410243 [Cladochytrium replicatum]|nr:hypothetical protein BJ742DRAFT_410243 [Cladochytrium replicatum]